MVELTDARIDPSIRKAPLNIDDVALRNEYDRLREEHQEILNYEDYAAELAEARLMTRFKRSPFLEPPLLDYDEWTNVLPIADGWITIDMVERRLAYALDMLVLAFPSGDEAWHRYVLRPWLDSLANAAHRRLEQSEWALDNAQSRLAEHKADGTVQNEVFENSLHDKEMRARQVELQVRFFESLVKVTEKLFKQETGDAWLPSGKKGSPGTSHLTASILEARQAQALNKAARQERYDVHRSHVLIITGARDFRDMKLFHREMTANVTRLMEDDPRRPTMRSKQDLLVVHSCLEGPSLLASSWCMENGIRAMPIHPDHGNQKRTSMVRANSLMLEYALIARWAGVLSFGRQPVAEDLMRKARSREELARIWRDAKLGSPAEPDDPEPIPCKVIE